MGKKEGEKKKRIFSLSDGINGEDRTFT